MPAILIGRMAVDTAERVRGIGRELLIEALVKSAHAADAIGARVVLTHTINEHARAFYLRYGFEPSPTDPLHLMMLMKDIRRSL